MKYTSVSKRELLEKNTTNFFAGLFNFFLSLWKSSQTEGKSTFYLLKKIEHDTAINRTNQITLMEVGKVGQKALRRQNLAISK